MKNLIAALCLMFAALPLAIAAQSDTHSGTKATAQQQRMAECSHKSKGLKGAEHKKFMSECLKGHKTTAATPAGAASTSHASKKSTQQEKMKSCNAQAKSKKLSGADRKHFMSQCLKA